MVELDSLVGQVSFKFSRQKRLTFLLQISCFYLPSAKITETYHRRGFKSPFFSCIPQPDRSLSAKIGTLSKQMTLTAPEVPVHPDQCRTQHEYESVSSSLPHRHVHPPGSTNVLQRGPSWAKFKGKKEATVAWVVALQLCGDSRK